MKPLNIGVSEQSLLQQALSALGAVAWKWDLDKGAFNYTQVLAEDLGLIEGSEAFSLFERISSEDLDKLSQLAAKAHAGREAFEALVHVNVHGDYHPFRIIGSRVDQANNANRTLAGVLLAGVDTGFLLNSILNNASILVYVKDLAGHYLFTNQQYAALSGTSSEEILGKTDPELFGENISKQLNRFEAWVVESGETIQLEEQLPFNQNGKTYLAGRFPIRNSQGDVYALGGVLTDITLNKTFESTIDMQRKQLRQVIDATPAQIWQLNHWGEICELNANAAQALGIPIEEAKGRTILELLPWWDDPAERHREIRHVIRTGKPLLGSIECYEKDGVPHWLSVDKIPMLNVDSETTQLLLVATDISDLKRHEQILARNDARYRAFIANSSEAIFGIGIEPPMPIDLNEEAQLQWLFEHCRYIECNQLYADSFSVKAEDIAGKTISQFNFARFQGEGDLRFFIRQQYNVNNYVIEQQHVNGRPRWLDISVRSTLQDGHLCESWVIYRDITESKLAEIALQKREARYRKFIETSHEGIYNFILDSPVDITLPAAQQVEHVLQHIIVNECNDEYARQSGYMTAAEMEGSYLKHLINIDKMRDMAAYFVGNAYKVSRFESQSHRDSDNSVWLSASVEGIVEDGMLLGCWGTQRNITERKKYLEELEYQATHDSLTLLPNRKKLYIEAEKAIASRDTKTPLALMLIDLDRFKEINDTLGHHMGDRLLKQLGPRLEIEICDCPGIVARLGGDEFAVMLVGASEQEALAKAQQILSSITQTFDLDDFKADISASIGISFCPKHGDDVGTLMRYADVAMYRAKTESLGFLEYSADFDKHTPKRLTLMTDLGRAIRQDQLHLHYQPKLNLDNGFVTGFEALLRWTHPEHGFIPPAEFIPLAEPRN